MCIYAPSVLSEDVAIMLIGGVFPFISGNVYGIAVLWAVRVGGRSVWRGSVPPAVDGRVSDRRKDGKLCVVTGFIGGGGD